MPKRHPTSPGADDIKHCLYHKNMGHMIWECVTLRDRFEELIWAGQLKKYVGTDRGNEPMVITTEIARYGASKVLEDFPTHGLVG